MCGIAGYIGFGNQKVLGNPQLAEKISNQGYNDVQKYNWINRAKNILDFIS